MSAEATNETDVLPNLVEAVANAMKAVKRLAKEHDNNFAKFKYTSVDDFKDALRPIMAANGLSVHMDERRCKMISIPDDKGKDRQVLRYKFACTLRHTSGEKADPENVTVTLPFVGAQTTGQARSYALKEYLKSEFMASSGDSEDADKDEVSEELSKQEARSLYNELQTELAAAARNSEAAMEDWAKKRMPSIEAMPKDWRVQLKRQYREWRISPPPEASEEIEPFDLDAFLTQLDEELSVGDAAGIIEEIFDNLDVQSNLTGDDEALSAAFKVKQKHLERVGAD